MTIMLTAVELRVLACLIEKSFTTPDQYPLTTNALTSACNQKTSRDPVVDYGPQLVDQTMLELRQAGWARSVRGSGNRAFKHRHVVDEKLSVSDAAMAILAVMSLRGPQSVGELRTRTERYGTFGADGDEATAEIEAVLGDLAGRDEPLVANVGRAPGQSQDRWAQLIGVSDSQPTVGSDSERPDGRHFGELEPSSGLTTPEPAAPLQARRSPPPASPPTESVRQVSAVEFDALTARLSALEQRVADLEELL